LLALDPLVRGAALRAAVEAQDAQANGPAPRVDAKPAKLPHVCFVAPECWPVLSSDADLGLIGGAEVQQCILARMFAAAGYPVSMICLDYGQPQRVALDGITVHRAHAPDAGIPMLRFIHPRLTAMLRAMADVDADIYYQRSAAMLTAAMAGFCRQRRRRSVYAAASDSDFLPGKQQIQYSRDRWLFERGLRAVDRIVVQNPRQQADCFEHYGRQSTLVPSCYELPAGAKPCGGDTVLWVATMRSLKRPELFIEIAKRLPGIHFVMAGGQSGDPGGAEYFESIRAAAAPVANLEFLGFLPLAKVEPWFDRARVLVNTSVYEGLPNTFLQAWARAVPTVSWIDTGARIDGEPVYPVVASVDAAAGEIARLFGDGSEFARVAGRCFRYFSEHHSPRHVLQCYQRVFGELMDAESR